MEKPQHWMLSSEWESRVLSPGRQRTVFQYSENLHMSLIDIFSSLNVNSIFLYSWYIILYVTNGQYGDHSFKGYTLCTVTEKYWLWSLRCRVYPCSILNFLLIRLLLAVLGLHCCTDFSLVAATRGSFLAAARGLRVAVASRGAEHGLQACTHLQLWLQALERGLSSWGSRPQWLCGTWDLPGPGIEPVSPALVVDFFSCWATGKPPVAFLKRSFKNMDHFYVNYWICYNIASVVCFVFLATNHVGSYLLDQGSNPHPLHWKAKS